MKSVGAWLLKGSTYKLFRMVLISLFALFDGPLYAQSELGGVQQSSSAGSEQLAAFDVVESAVQDMGFLLTLHDGVSENTRLLQQLKEDYFPLFYQKAIARLALQSRFSNLGNARREYLECLVGLRFFNAHLDIVAEQSGEGKLFEIVHQPLTNDTDKISVDVKMSRGEESFQITYRLTYRKRNASWKIFDIRIGTSSMLNSMRKGLAEIHKEAIGQNGDAYKQATQFLIGRNSGRLINASQWCKPVTEDLSAPEVTNQLDKTEGNDIYEVKATLNGQQQSVYLEVSPNGTVLYQDDIILGSDGDLAAAVSGLDFRKLRLWSGAVIPYIVDETVSDKEKVLSAIEEWDKSTPVRFIEAGGDDKNYLVFSEGDGCRSALGMRGGRQYITLGSGCSYGAVLHEIGHTLGLIHEHNRDDRDEFVTVKLRNVLYEKERNFYKHPTGHPVSDAYCYGSIMHYSEHAFSISRELKTIVPKGHNRIGQRKQLSTCDVARIRKLYAPLAKGSTPDGKKNANSQEAE